MTATRNNCEEIFSDELIDFFFDEKSVFYGFVFQYMPEGREPDPALMPTPEQRLWMWKRSWEVIEERKIPLFDFWNHGTMIGGCVAAGRERGYLYVDWDGNVMPCVFAPYSTCNIHEIHSRGGTLNDAWGDSVAGGHQGMADQARHLRWRGRVRWCWRRDGVRLPRQGPLRRFHGIIEHSGAKPVDSSADSFRRTPRS